MASATIIAVGDKVPIALVLEDGNTAQYPQAEIYNLDGVLITTLDLTHLSSGLYTVGYIMPDTAGLEVTFITYSNIGHTTENPAYGRDIDVFLRGGMSMNTVYEGTATVQDLFRTGAAVLFGKSLGGGTDTVYFRDAADTKDRVEAKVTTAGNRRLVTLDASD